MTDFKKIELCDVAAISEYLKYQDFGMCDFTAPTLYMWRNYFDTQFLIKDGVLFLRHENFEGKRAYLYPLSGDRDNSFLDFIFDYEIKKEKRDRIDFCLVPKEKCDDVATYFYSRYPHIRVSITNDAAWDDYIYLADEILGFPGKKLHGQKNHLNFFNRNFPECSCTDITPENAQLIKQFVISGGVDENANDIEKAEHEGLLEYLDSFSYFPDSFGVFLHIGQQIVGFAIAERAGKYLIIHNEKADKSYRGAYQKVFDSIMRRGINENIKYINREEDCGDQGLRYAKNAYHPHSLMKKCTVSFSGF